MNYVADGAGEIADRNRAAVSPEANRVWQQASARIHYPV